METKSFAGIMKRCRRRRAKPYGDQTDTVAHSEATDHEEPRSAALKGGDLDVDSTGLDVGSESPGWSNPTSDQDRVDDIGASVGIVYDDTEPLKFGDKTASKDRSRWELNPASSEDYGERRSSIRQVRRSPAPARARRASSGGSSRRRAASNPTKRKSRPTPRKKR